MLEAFFIMDKRVQTVDSKSSRHFERPGSDIKKIGYMVKQKTMKKKFFVLRSSSSSGAARLEYHDTEKKFQSGNLPKRSVQLNACMNINKKYDRRNGRLGIVLYTVHDCLTILTNSEVELDAWFETIIHYQHDDFAQTGVRSDQYDYVWQVTLQPRGLGQGKGVKGPHWLCLNCTTVNVFKVNTPEPQFSIQLVTIRAVAHNENSFWLELGNYASTGPGELWFTVEDTDEAKDVHTTILQFMSSVKDIFHKEQQFGHVTQKSSLHNDFGGPHQLNSDIRKSFSSWNGYPDDGGQGFMMDYSLNHPDALKDMPSPLCPSDVDGERSYFDMLAPDFPSMMTHHGSQSSHPGSMHGHNFSELLHPTHLLPTVKEGGSGEGCLLSDIPSCAASSSDFIRPDPVACLLSDEPGDLHPRTYSLGSRPTKKLKAFVEMGLRKGAGNEMSRATSAPHILKGRREREQTAESPAPAVSSLSMSLKSDDSDSFVEYGPIRPRTGSDSFNYRSQTSSLGKLQQACRPRSSSYGQGKRPVLNISKLNREKAIVSQDASQRTSRESSLQSSFESLRLSSESLHRTSQELRQPGGSNAGGHADMQDTPSPKMKNMKSDPGGCVDMQGGAGKRKSSHRTRRDSNGSGRLPADFMTSSSDHQHHQPHPQHVDEYTKMFAISAGTRREYINVEYSTQSSLISDTRSLPMALQHQSSRQEDLRYMNVNFNTNHKKSDGSRSLSMENVDTYFISDLHQRGSKPRTGSVGSKDKKILRPESAASSSVSVTSSTTPTSSVVTHQESHPFVSSTTRSFGSNDSVRKAPHQLSTEKYGILGKDFRKKSGSTGCRPVTKKTASGVAVGKEQHMSVASIMPSKNPSSTRLSEDDPTDEYIEFPLTATKDDIHHSHVQSSITQPGFCHVSQSGGIYSSLSGPYAFNKNIGSVHFSTPTAADYDYVHYDPGPPSGHVPHQEKSKDGTCCCCLREELELSHLQHSSKPSSVSAQAKQAASANGLEHNSIEPGMAPHSSSPCSSSDRDPIAVNDVIIQMLSNVNLNMFEESSDQPYELKDVYVGHKSSSSASAFSSSAHKLGSTKDPEEYVEYDPYIYSSNSDKTRTQGAFFAYLASLESSRTVGLTKPQQQHMMMHATTSGNRPASHTPCMDIRLSSSRSLTRDPPHQPGGTILSTSFPLPPVPPLSSSTATSQHQAQASVSSLESKINATRAKTRRSLGDIMSVVSTGSKESQVNRSASDASCSNSRTGGLQFTVRSGSRHSLSDIGLCQQMISSGLTSHDSRSSSSLVHGSSSVGGSTGDVEGSGSTMADQLTNSLNGSDRQDDGDKKIFLDEEEKLFRS